MKLQYIDTFSYHTGHLQFNASLLVMLSLIYDKKRISYLSGNNSAKELYKLLKGRYTLKNVKHKSIFVFPGNHKYALLMRYIISAITNIIILILSSPNTILIYNFNNVFSLRLINLINKILNRKILICCHGEMELMTKDTIGKGFLHKLLAFLIKDFFIKRRKIQQNIYFIVLGDSTKKNIEKILTEEQAKKIISIDHSYIFSQSTGTNDNYTNKRTINIGTVGIFNKSKGADAFVDLAAQIKNPIISLSITGQISYNIDILTKLKIDLPSNLGSSPLEQDEFNLRIRNLDFILFLYPPDSYTMAASGAILDAINMQKPIIAITNSYFNYIFNKFGNIGFLGSNLQDIIYYINHLQKTKVDNHTFSPINYTNIQKLLQPENLKDDLKNKLSNIKYY